MKPGDRVRVRRFNGRVECGEVVDDMGQEVRVRIDGRRGTLLVEPDRVQPERPAYVFTPQQHTEFGRMAPRPRRKPARSEAYLDYVRGHDCVSCGAGAPSEAHHWDGRESRALGRKVSDYATCPLCHLCHMTWHGQGHFPGMSRSLSEQIMRDSQRRLLLDWLDAGEW